MHYIDVYFISCLGQFKYNDHKGQLQVLMNLHSFELPRSFWESNVLIYFETNHAQTILTFSIIDIIICLLEMQICTYIYYSCLF